MSRSIREIVVCAALVSLPLHLQAQGVITGVLLDSLRGGAPIAGAEVLLGDAESPATVTDNTGRFRLASVPTGPNRVRVRHPRLDSLGLDLLERSATLRSARDSVHLEFATPSMSDALRLLCGGPAAEHPGVFGTVTDVFGRVVSGANVEVSWEEQVVGPQERSQRTNTARATSDERGLFTVCGAPAPRAIVTDAAGRTRVSSALKLTVRSAEHFSHPIELDEGGATAMSVMIRVGPDSLRTTASGTVLDSLGRPLAGARVGVDGAAAATAMTDEEGFFLLEGVPASTHQYRVRAIGYTPLLVTAASESGMDIDLGMLQLGKLPPSLDTIRVRASLLTRDQRAFAERRRVLQGTFLDEEEIAKLPRLSPSVVASRVSRAQIVNFGPRRNASKFVFRRPGPMGDVYCSPRFYLDGQDLGSEIGMDELESYLAIAKRVEVYRASFAPPEFTDFDGCGALVVWTR